MAGKMCDFTLFKWAKHQMFKMRGEQGFLLPRINASGCTTQGLRTVLEIATDGYSLDLLASLNTSWLSLMFLPAVDSSAHTFSFLSCRDLSLGQDNKEGATIRARQVLVSSQFTENNRAPTK